MIYFDDVFWHLSRETMDESFCRLLARQRFAGLGDFLRSIFETVEEAIECVSKCESFDALLKLANVAILTERLPDSDFVCRMNANSYPEFGRPAKTGSFEAFKGRKILFYDQAQNVLIDMYPQFVAALKEARQGQRAPEAWKTYIH